MVDADSISKVMNEIKEEVQKAECYINQLKEHFPQIIKSIQTKRAA
jgi:hypothetical protein